jgi:hypothetical protein
MYTLSHSLIAPCVEGRGLNLGYTKSSPSKVRQYAKSNPYVCLFVSSSSPKFNCALTAKILHMLELEFLESARA